MDDKDRLIRQVRAALNKTVERGCTEAEAASAAALVEKLVKTHALDLADEANTSDEIVSLLEPLRCPLGVDTRWLPFLASLAADLCLCRALNWHGAGGGILFAGRGSEVSAARETYRFLREQAMTRSTWEWVDQRKTFGRTKFINAFVMGYVEGIAARVRSNPDPVAGKEIVASRSADIDRYLAENYEVTDRPLQELRVDAAAYERGVAHGSEVAFGPSPEISGQC